MHDAKTHLSRLADEVHDTGESFIIAKAGKPWVQVTVVATKKPQIGALAKKYRRVDTDELDKLDEEISASFYASKN
jgi:antitoxin (DNA-binding transcriptional repressor) of toxin-antitoxin stability system